MRIAGGILRRCLDKSPWTIGRGTGAAGDTGACDGGVGLCGRSSGGGLRWATPTLDRLLHESPGVRVWRGRVPRDDVPAAAVAAATAEKATEEGGDDEEEEEEAVVVGKREDVADPTDLPTDSTIPVVVKRIESDFFRTIETTALDAVRGVDGFTQLLWSYRDPADNALCLVMPAYGPDMLDWTVASADGMSVGDARRMATDVGRCLVYLHRRVGVAHLDVKPENLFRCAARRGRRRTVVVGDFGSAHDLRHPRLRSLVGTDRYAPPELRGDGPVYLFSEKSDAYSLGLTTYVAVMRTNPPTRDPAALVRDLRDRCRSAADVAFVDHCVGSWLRTRPVDRATVETGLRAAFSDAATAVV